MLRPFQISLVFFSDKKQKARIRMAGNTVRGTDACVYLPTAHEIDKAKIIFVSLPVSKKIWSAGGGALLSAGGVRCFPPSGFFRRTARKQKKACFSDDCGLWIKQAFCRALKLSVSAPGNHAGALPGKGVFGTFPQWKSTGIPYIFILLLR